MAKYLELHGINHVLNIMYKAEAVQGRVRKCARSSRPCLHVSSITRGIVHYKFSA
jgi:hypothetical protein